MKINKNGFTLIELMVVIALIGILSSIAIPSIWHWRKERVLSDTAQKIQRVLQLARLAAIDENARVVVQFTTGFGGGAYAFVDEDLTNDLTNGERIVARETMPPKIKLVSADFGSGGSGGPSTSYTRIGLPRTGFNGNIVLANDTSDSYRRITLSAAGNLRTQKSTSDQF